MLPSIDFLLNFCDFFKISLSEFFNEDRNYPTKYEKLISKIDKLSPEQFNALISLLDSMISSR